MATSWIWTHLVCSAVLVLSSGAAVHQEQRQARSAEEVGPPSGPLPGPLAVLLLRRPLPASLLVQDAAGDGGLLGAADGGPSADLAPLDDTLFVRAAKRQVRYHQCYFNPITCFG